MRILTKVKKIFVKVFEATPLEREIGIYAPIMRKYSRIEEQEQNNRIWRWLKEHHV